MMAQTRVVAGCGDGEKDSDLRYILKMEPIGYNDGHFCRVWEREGSRMILKFWCGQLEGWGGHPLRWK